MSIACFSQLIIYQNCSNNNHPNVLSKNGQIHIIENEESKNLELVLCEPEFPIIYFKCKLIDLNVYLLEFKSGRIHLKQQGFFFEISYFIDFKDAVSAEEFLNTIGILNEGFLLPSVIESLVDDSNLEEECNNVQGLCDSLENSIKSGNEKDSVRIVKILAAKRLQVNIKLIEKNEVDKIEQNDRKLCKVNVNLIRDKKACNMNLKLQANEFTVLDLKKEICAYYSLELNDLIVSINDFQTCDSNLLELYRVVRASTSANAQLSSDFECIVYLKSLRPDLEFNFVNDNENKSNRNYDELAAYYTMDITDNFEPFHCQICLEENVPVSHGVVLKDCLHVFCKECLKDYINNSENPQIKCPYSNDYVCDSVIQEREIRSLISRDDYLKYESKILRISEASMANTVHCLTPDCIGFCVSEDNLNFFDCPVCLKVNCLQCNAIHMKKTCQEYQEYLKLKSVNDLNAKKDKEALERLIDTGKAMKCPGCQIIVCKQSGCDWLKCTSCQTEICWVTKGPRWGPKGRGDTSGGCKCNFQAGKPCHPNCGNCH